MGTLKSKSRNNSEVYKNLGLLENNLAIEDGASHPQVISVIGCVLERSIEKNDKWLKKSRRKDGVTVFHGSKTPTLNIRQYLERIYKYSKCSCSCFVVAYIYMDRFIQATRSCLTSLNAHRLLIASVLVATKFLEDVSYNNAYFAKVGGVSIAELNKLEVKLLCSLDYRLNITLEMFDRYCMHLEKVAAETEKRVFQIQTCGLMLKKDMRLKPTNTTT